jgi:hypothetical protein
MGKKKQTKQEVIDDVVDLLGKIEKAEVEVEKAQIELEGRKEAAKTAKGVWLTRVDALRQLCRTRKRWAEEAKKQPLFNQGKKQDAPATVPKPADDKWKALTLAAAAISDKHIDKLEAAGVHTIGELSEKMNRHGQFWGRELGLARQRVAIEDEFNRYLMEITPKTEEPKSEPEAEVSKAS